MAAITAVQDRLNFDTADYKTYRGISGASLDAQITDALAAAKRAADEFMGNPFLERRTYGERETDDIGFDDLTFWDGNRLDGCGGRLGHSTEALYAEDAAELDIPEQVKLGVIAYVDAVLDVLATAEGTPGSGAHTTAPVTSEKVGELAKTWAAPSEQALVQGGAFLGRLGYVAETYWSMFRIDPGF